MVTSEKKEVEEYFDLVWYVIYKEFRVFVNKNPDYKEDLFQEGCIGLLRGLKNYDESKGLAIASFLYHTIKCDMLKFVTRYCNKYKKLNTISLEYPLTEDLKLGDALESNYAEVDEIKILKEKVKESKIKGIETIMKLYSQGKIQREIGEVLNTTQMEISRRMKKFKKELVS